MFTKMKKDSHVQQIHMPETLYGTNIEVIYRYISSLYVRCVTEIPPLLTALILALMVAAIGALIDHALIIGLSFVESLHAWRYLLSVFLICSAATLVQLFHPTVRGSGIPEMKLFLCDSESTRLKDYLSLRAFFTKVIGLLLASLSGLPVGKEGPFVHISCIVSYYTKFRFLPKVQRILMQPFSCLFYLNSGWLKYIRINYRKKQLHYMRDADVYRTLSSACALGVACTFGAPIGGVMFSIEVTSKLFDVANYWLGFFTAAVGAVVFRILMSQVLHDHWFFRPFMPSNLPNEEYGLNHFLTYVFIGISCGIFSCIFIVLYIVYFKSCQVIQRVIGFFLQAIPQTAFKSSIFHERSSPRRVAIAFFFSLIASVMLAIIDLLFRVNSKIPLSQHHQLRLFFDNGTLLMDIFNVHLPEKFNSSAYEVDFTINMHNYFKPLISFIIYKLLVICPLVICLPVPAGIFFPVLTVGACIGRLIGDLTKISSAGCAIVGAAALSGAVTHTVSTAVILTEMTEEIQYLLPCACSAFIGKFISQLICRLSIYDMIMRQRFMPYVPREDEESFEKFKRVRAKHIVEHSLSSNIHEYALYRDVSSDHSASCSTNDDLRLVLRKNLQQQSSINRWFLLPVMRRDRGFRELMGYVRCDAAMTYLKDNFCQTMQFHFSSPHWLMTKEEFMQINSIECLFGSKLLSWQSFFSSSFSRLRSDWLNFLSNEIDWRELLEEGPCSVRASVGLPDIHDFTYRNQIPQVFVLDGSSVIGTITREIFVEHVKLLHRTEGFGSYWSAVNINIANRRPPPSSSKLSRHRLENSNGEFSGQHPEDEMQLLGDEDPDNIYVDKNHDYSS